MTFSGVGEGRPGLSTTDLGVDGCFELAARARGRQRLELWNTGYRQVRVNVLDEVVLAAATTPWSVEWETGVVVVTGVEPGDALLHRWQLDALVVETRAEADETGRVEFGGLPAGEGTLAILGDAGVRSIEVVAGESLELRY